MTRFRAWGDADWPAIERGRVESMRAFIFFLIFLDLSELSGWNVRGARRYMALASTSTETVR